MRPTDEPTSGLHQARFDTDGMAESDARLAYLDRLDGILDTIFLAPFVARLDAYRMGSFSILRLVATARQSRRLSSRIQYDRYDSIGVQYVLTGSAAVECNGRRVDSDPGGVIILDYAQPFVVTDISARTVLNVAVPRAMFPDRHTDPAQWHGMVLTGRAAAPLGAFLGELYAVIDMMPAAAGPALASAFWHLLAVAIGDHGASSATSDRNARLIERAMHLVDDRIGSDDLDPTWLAAKLGISRSEIYSAMEPYGGVARFITQRRLVRAREALEDPADRRRIGALAYAFGFSSEAHFSRAFRAAFGATPSALRRRAAVKR